jgi:hypothetical protein
MTEITELLSNTVTIGTSKNANGSVHSAKLVRVLALSPLQVSLFDTVANVQIGSVVMSTDSSLQLEKKPTDILVANDAANCLAVSQNLERVRRLKPVISDFCVRVVKDFFGPTVLEYVFANPLFMRLG